MIASVESNVPTITCMKPLNTTDARASRQSDGGMNYVRHGSAAGKRATDGGTKMRIVGIPSGIGMTMITTPTDTEVACLGCAFLPVLPPLMKPATRAIPGEAS